MTTIDRPQALSTFGTVSLTALLAACSDEREAVRLDRSHDGDAYDATISFDVAAA